jgi:hypothetical protein
MARWARVSLVEATIFIVLVIFSMLRIDLRRPSISRSVAYVAPLLAVRAGMAAAALRAGLAVLESIVMTSAE